MLVKCHLSFVLYIRQFLFYSVLVRFFCKQLCCGQDIRYCDKPRCHGGLPQTTISITNSIQTGRYLWSCIWSRQCRDNYSDMLWVWCWCCYYHRRMWCLGKSPEWCDVSSLYHIYHILFIVTKGCAQLDGYVPSFAHHKRLVLGRY